MNRKLSDWASIAEIVGGLAVVITLFFLILGIRDNTDVTRVSVYSDLMKSLNDLEANALGDPELSRILGAYFANDFQELNESDKLMLTRYLHILFRGYEVAFFSQEFDVIGEPEWSRFERLICINWGRVETSGVSGLDVVLTESFLSYISESCPTPVE